MKIKSAKLYFWPAVVRRNSNAALHNVERIISFSVVLLLCLMSSNTHAELYEVAVLQGLDKVTARVSTINAPIGRVVRFGTLEIIARTCDKRPPEETPESAAFLDIWEAPRGEPAASLFRGWMYASSPALSPMEHPVYDVWVLDCRNSSSIAPSILPSNPSSKRPPGSSTVPSHSRSPLGGAP